MRFKTHRVTNTHWWRLCPDCGKWFEIFLKMPGTKIRANLPQCCKQCSKSRAKKTDRRVFPPIKERIREMDNKEIDNIVSLFLDDCA